MEDKLNGSLKVRNVDMANLSRVDPRNRKAFEGKKEKKEKKRSRLKKPRRTAGNRRGSSIDVVV